MSDIKWKPIELCDEDIENAFVRTEINENMSVLRVYSSVPFIDYCMSDLIKISSRLGYSLVKQAEGVNE